MLGQCPFPMILDNEKLQSAIFAHPGLRFLEGQAVSAFHKLPTQVAGLVDRGGTGVREPVWRT
jgi:hypothetical protein